MTVPSHLKEALGRPRRTDARRSQSQSGSIVVVADIKGPERRRGDRKTTRWSGHYVLPAVHPDGSPLAVESVAPGNPRISDSGRNHYCFGRLSTWAAPQRGTTSTATNLGVLRDPFCVDNHNPNPLCLRPGVETTRQSTDARLVLAR